MFWTLSLRSRVTLEEWIASGLLAPRNDVHFLLPTVYFLLHFFDRSVVLLERLHGAVAVTSGGDALDGVVGTGEGRDVGNLVLDGGLADGAFVLDGVALCPRRVDDEVHLLVQDDVENVRAAFGDLVHHFALDTGRASGIPYRFRWPVQTS